jgi:transcriptional regulator with XRE-family HTH domain
VDAEIALEVGRALRDARRSRGLTLKEVGLRSGGSLTAGAVAGYERGERDISLRRFIHLATLYAIPPARLIGEIDRRIRGRPRVIIDVPSIERLGRTEGMLVADFVHEVRTLRRSSADVITLRDSDLEVLATASGASPEQLTERIATAVLPEQP